MVCILALTSVPRPLSEEARRRRWRARLAALDAVDVLRSRLLVDVHEVARGRRPREAGKDLKERQQDLDRACTELEEAQEQLELQLEEGNEAPPCPGGGSQYGEQTKEERAETAAEFVAAMKTRIHECEGALRQALGGFGRRREITGERAVHRRRREDNILTLFASLGAADNNKAWDPRSQDDPPYKECATVDVAVGC